MLILFSIILSSSQYFPYISNHLKIVYIKPKTPLTTKIKIVPLTYNNLFYTLA